MDIVETTSLIDQLIKAKIPKKTATNLLNYVEKSQSRKTDFKLNVIFWVLGIIFTLMLYLHNDSVSRMEKIENKLVSDISDLKIDIAEIKAILKK